MGDIRSYLRCEYLNLVFMAFAFSKTALLLLSLGGCLTLWGFSYTNGLLQILTEHCEPAAQQLSTTGPKRTVYTGIGPVDGQLTTLITFFYTAIDGNRPDVSMVGLDFVGQIIATWMLMVLESLRKGNRGKLLTWYVNHAVLTFPAYEV